MIFTQWVVQMFEQQGHLYDVWMKYAVPLFADQAINHNLLSKCQFSLALVCNFKHWPPLNISNSCQPAAPFIIFLHTRPCNSWHNCVSVIPKRGVKRRQGWMRQLVTEVSSCTWPRFKVLYQPKASVFFFWSGMNSTIHVRVSIPRP